MGKEVTIRLEVEEVEHVLEGLRVWRDRWELTRLHHERGWCTEGELLCDCADARTAAFMEAYLRELEEKIGRGMGGCSPRRHKGLKGKGEEVEGAGEKDGEGFTTKAQRHKGKGSFYHKGTKTRGHEDTKERG